MNRACAEFLQVSQEDVAGRRFEDLVGKDAFAVLKPYIDQALQGHFVDFEAEIPYRVAGPRYMRGTYTPDVDERGKVAGWIASTTARTVRALILKVVAVEFEGRAALAVRCTECGAHGPPEHSDDPKHANFGWPSAHGPDSCREVARMKEKELQQ
jgi:hypothetical protein